MADDATLAVLGQFTPQKALTPHYGDAYLFFVGKDDVHGILRRLLQNERVGLKMNMFGYDDDELNQIILGMVKDPSIHVQVSLDKSQSGGVHEKQILALDEAQLGNDFGNSFTVLQSATHQISHTKGGVLIGQGIYFEGSTNWSDSGEGTLKPKGYKAQNNTLLVSTNKTNLLNFAHELDKEHLAGLAQGVGR